MNRMQQTFIFILVLILGRGMGFSQALAPMDGRLEKKVDSVLALMTLEEKIGQMTLFTSDWDVTGPTLRENYKEDVQQAKVGAIFNAHTAAYNKELQRLAVEETRLGIPLIFGYDVIHGYKTIFPIPLGTASSWNLEAIEQSARVAAIEASAAGLNWTFAPMVDIARDPRWGRIAEGAGEDTYLGSQIAMAQVKGFQGEDLSANNTLMACAKHYAAYGAAQAGRDYHTVDMSERKLRQTYLPPFKAALDAGVGTFMTSFNELDGVPATGNSFLLTEILREEWGFNGFVVTDYTSINEMVPHGIVANDKEAAALSVNAGVDMDMQGATYYNYLKELVAEGEVSEANIDQSVRYILRMKFELGLFADPYRYTDEARQEKYVFSEEHRAIARDVARKSMVLLENKNQTLPLKSDLKKIAVIGPLADSPKDMLGNWFGAGAGDKAVSLLQGIKGAMKGKATVNYSKGCDIEGENQDDVDINKAVVQAKNSDIIIASVGEAGWMSGEAASRANIDLPGVQLNLLKALKATGKPLVVVLFNGRPLELNWLSENADALLEAWFPGTEAGHAIADVLMGAYNPSGKLTVSFPRALGQVPIFYSIKNTGRPISENKYTSKYLDVPNTPLYPFGYGLSYTNFEYSDFRQGSQRLGSESRMEVSVKVKNTGDRAGTETVQLYIRDMVGSVTRPLRELKGFQQISLDPGEDRMVSFTIDHEDLAFYTRDMDYEAEPGNFEIWIGGDSNAELGGSFEFFIESDR